MGQGSAENLAVHKQRGDDLMRFKRNAGARKLACAHSFDALESGVDLVAPGSQSP